MRSKYTPKSPPTLSSKYLDFLRTLQEKSDVTRTGKSVGKNRKEKSKKQFSKVLTQEFSIFPPYVLFRRDACAREN